MTSVSTLPDRRSNRRYALQTPLQYRAANSPLRSAWKRGCALNMSASGILIDIPERIAAGGKLELAVDWTGLYHDRQMMRLYLIASVTRTGRHGTALRILSHRFRDVSPMHAGVRRAEKNLAVA